MVFGFLNTEFYSHDQLACSIYQLLNCREKAFATVSWPVKNWASCL